ncbi:MAG TPA: glycerophosphodiester phosphodiesterase family protein [Blastocatellia bacterium]|nr:glycerophosphodiester phosphodiesterase family protein [Blastocatellia bacterium]
MLRSPLLTLLLLLLIPATTISRPDQPEHRRLLIAHRGASGYAPEHTLAAYQIAIEQGADFVEQDLQITKDGVLICMHDPELSRTTNVAELFSDRATVRDPEATGKPHRGYFVMDFTLAEIKRLDAGSWFNRANPFAARAEFAAERVPTLEETMAFVGKRAGLYIELKHYPFYKRLGFDMAAQLVAMLKAHGFERAPERIFIQSFFKEALQRMQQLAPRYPRVQLLPMEDAGRKDDSAKISAPLAQEIARYAQGAGPNKTMLKDAGDVKTLHDAGLVIHPYTFRGQTLPVVRRPLDEKQANGASVRDNIIADIRRYLGYGIDGGFTDYPQLWRDAVAEK